MFRRKKISFRETLLTKKKPDLLHAIYYEMVSNSVLYSKKVFLKYASLGIIGTIVDFAILLALTEFVGMHYIFSAIIGAIFGFYVNYLLNKKYIVRERGYKQHKLNFWFTFTYFIISFLCFVFAILFLVFLVERYSMGYFLANAISSFIFFLLRYFAHKILFNKFGH